MAGMNGRRLNVGVHTLTMMLFVDDFDFIGGY
jgi:hypothetical protein